MASSMMLITANWGKEKSFKMVPLTLDCPFNEVIFDPKQKILALISKERKQSLHMLVKLNDQGDPVKIKIGSRPDGKDYAEERKLLETYYEYYVEDLNEIEVMINMLAVNASTFDFQQYLKAAPQSNIVQSTSKIITS